MAGESVNQVHCYEAGDQRDAHEGVRLECRLFLFVVFPISFGVLAAAAEEIRFARDRRLVECVDAFWYYDDETGAYE